MLFSAALLYRWAEDNNQAVWIEQQDEERQMTYINLLRYAPEIPRYSHEVDIYLSGW